MNLRFLMEHGKAPYALDDLSQLEWYSLAVFDAELKKLECREQEKRLSEMRRRTGKKLDGD